MSEKISVVLPNGTIDKVKAAAILQDDTQSALLRKFILNGLRAISKDKMQTK
jgi:peroxiredoxin family protein